MLQNYLSNIGSGRRRVRASDVARGFPIETLERRALLSVGGGWVGAGVTGAYYANATLNGTAAFTRFDDRIDSDWGGLSPSGSTAPGFASVGATNWSAQWTGDVIAKYSQTYTFSLTTAGGARLYIRPAGSTTYTTLVDDWAAHDSTTDTGTYALVAGQKYDIELQYFDDTRDAVTRLHWSSPSTPDEAIEPATPVGINGATAQDYDAGVMFADAMKMARLSSWTGTNGATLDSNGWPTGDGWFYLFAGQTTDTSGTYTLTFTGKATVSLSLSSLTIISPDTYNSMTNTSSMVFNLTAPASGTLEVNLTNTRRLATDQTATGITNLSIMRPTSPGATSSYAAGTLFTSAYKNLISSFTAIRFMDYLATNGSANSVVNWTDTLSPAFSTQQGLTGGYQGQGGAPEYAVELANETGKDLWYNVPLQASDAYITDLANGLKYGFSSNGTAYTSFQASPAYPPLNPNLKVYLELSNEVWNSGFPQNGLSQTLAVNAVNSNTATGQIINYDNIGTGQATLLGERWWILRTTQMSTDFRTVWGNAAMMSTIRPVFEFQYSNTNSTGSNTLGFIEDYFDNGDGVQHVTTPEPVNYYLYGAGGGWYNNVNNESGLGEVTIPNNNFQTPALTAPSAQADPAGASWAFTSTAGIVTNDINLASDATSTTLGTLTAPTSSQLVGYKFTVGPTNIELYSLGFYVAPGDTGSHTVYLVDSTQTNELASAVINTSGATSGAYDYANIGPIVLKSGQTYYIVSTESDDSYYNQGTHQVTNANVTVNNAVSVNTSASSWNLSQWIWTNGTAGNVAGPVDFKYAVAAVGSVGYPPNAISGNQSAYIQGTGSFSQSVTFPAGVSDVTFYAAQAVTGSENFTVSIDGTPLPANWQTPFVPGSTNYSDYTTGVGLNLTAGSHTITFQGAGNGTAYISDIQVQSADAVINSGVQNISSTVTSEADWAAAYGLVTVGYEGGFETGASAETPASIAANVDPRTEQATIDTLDEYLAAGGDLPIVFNATGGAYAVAETPTYGEANVYDLNTPKLLGYASVTSAAPVTDTNATLVPGVLTPANASVLYSNSYGGTYEDQGGDILKNTGWISWNTMAPASGAYTITATTTGSGSADLVVDGNIIGNIATSGTFVATINLSTGVHAIRVESTGSAVITINQIAVAEAGAPAAPVLTSAVFGDTVGYLSWQSVPGAAGYTIGYSTVAGPYTNFVYAGNATTFDLTGLDNTKIYDVAVYAYSTGGQMSLPSAAARLAHRSTDPQTLINFENQTVSTGSTPVTEPLVTNGFSFTSIGAEAGKALQIWGTAGPDYFRPTSNALFVQYWGASQQFVKQNGGNFDLYSLDLWANLYEANDSVVITGYDSTGGTVQQIENFGANASNNLITATLDWVDIDKVTVSWWSAANGGGAGRFGGIDNILIDKAVAPAILTTSLPGANQYQSYSTQIIAAGGALPYGWAFTGGTLPGGLQLESDGTLTGTPTASGTFNFTATVTGGNGGAISQAFAVNVAPTVIPAVTSFTVDNGTTQRSMVRTLTVAFNTPVTLDANAFALSRTTGGTTAITYSAVSSDGGMTYVITPTSGTYGGSLTDGNYSLVITPSGVHNKASPSTTMTGSPLTYTFFRLFGDSNGDGTVNATDYRAFEATYLKSTGQVGFNAIFDYNNDGTINATDYRAFTANYLHSITS